MEELGTGGLIGVVAGIVAVIGVALKIVDKVLDYFLGELKKKRDNGKGDDERLPSKGGHTADLAVQRHVIGEVHADVERMSDLVRDANAILSKDLPHKLDQLMRRHEQTLGKLQGFESSLALLQAAIEGNTAATRALYDMLAKILQSR